MLGTHHLSQRLRLGDSAPTSNSRAKVSPASLPEHSRRLLCGGAWAMHGALQRRHCSLDSAEDWRGCTQGIEGITTGAGDATAISSSNYHAFSGASWRVGHGDRRFPVSRPRLEGRRSYGVTTILVLLRFHLPAGLTTRRAYPPPRTHTPPAGRRRRWPATVRLTGRKETVASYRRGTRAPVSRWHLCRCLEPIL